MEERNEDGSPLRATAFAKAPLQTSGPGGWAGWGGVGTGAGGGRGGEVEGGGGGGGAANLTVVDVPGAVDAR